MLKARRHQYAPHVIVVVNTAYPPEAGNCVYRFNERVGKGQRAKGHAGPSPSLQQLSVAVANV